jgi:protein ImuA
MSPNLDALRAQIQAIETHGRPASAYLPTGAIDLDAALGGGLSLGGVSEVSPASFLDEPASIQFALACIAIALQQRTGDVVILQDATHWARTWGGLYGPGLQKMGICPSRILWVRTRDAKSFHACLEDSARTTGLAGVLALSGPKSGFSLAGARRVQLAAEAAHSLVLAVHGVRTSAFAPARARLVLASRACRPIQIGTALPALGPPAWTVHLERTRNGARPQSFDLEYDDATHRLYQPAVLANRSPHPQRRYA